jgi:hypothetical protein
MNNILTYLVLLAAFGLAYLSDRAEHSKQAELVITKEFNQICHRLGGESTEPASTTCNNVPQGTETMFTQAYNKQIGRTELYISHSLDGTYDIYE